jgi:hypothetical protein
MTLFSLLEHDTLHLVLTTMVSISRHTELVMFHHQTFICLILHLLYRCYMYLKFLCINLTIMIACCLCEALCLGIISRMRFEVIADLVVRTHIVALKGQVLLFVFGLRPMFLSQTRCHLQVVQMWPCLSPDLSTQY